MRGHAFRPSGEPVAVIARDDPRQDANCFADEVTIDFPSVAPAVDRIRKAFLADERPRTLRAVVELTERDALAGVTLPLDVPVFCTCASCGGRGESWTEICPRCRGLGSEPLRHAVHVTVPAGVHTGARFCFTLTPRHHSPTRIELHVVVSARQ